MNDRVARDACLQLVGQRPSPTIRCRNRFHQDPANVIAVSATSIWEIVIKSDLGKLKLARPVREILDRQRANGIAILPVSLEHVLQLESFPRPHKDPFDRLIAAAAAYERMALISSDPIFSKYPVHVLW